MLQQKARYYSPLLLLSLHIPVMAEGVCLQLLTAPIFHKEKADIVLSDVQIP